MGNAPSLSKRVYRGDFPAEEMKARRAKVVEAIGSSALAILQGAENLNSLAPLELSDVERAMRAHASVAAPGNRARAGRWKEMVTER